MKTDLLGHRLACWDVPDQLDRAAVTLTKLAYFDEVFAFDFDAGFVCAAIGVEVHVGDLLSQQALIRRTSARQAACGWCGA